jgi:pilus assembly protein CpaB
MGKNKAVIILGAGIFAALLVSFLTYGWLQKKSNVQVQAAETQPILVAALDMAWGTVLSKDMVKAEPFLKKSLPAGYFVDAAKVEGRTLLQPVKAGEPIFESRLAPTTAQGGGVGAIITPKKRAMAVKVDKVVGVSGFIYPGNRVDVLVTMDQSEKIPLSMTKIVLENVLVLAAGPEMEKGGKQEKPAQVDVITLEVTPEEGERLALAATKGKLQLALRNSADSAEANTRGITIPALLNASVPQPSDKTAAKKKAVASAARPAPAPVKPQIITVELVRGSALSSAKFEKGE